MADEGESCMERIYAPFVDRFVTTKALVDDEDVMNQLDKTKEEVEKEVRILDIFYHIDATRDEVISKEELKKFFEDIVAAEKKWKGTGDREYKDTWYSIKA